MALFSVTALVDLVCEGIVQDIPGSSSGGSQKTESSEAKRVFQLSRGFTHPRVVRLECVNGTLKDIPHPERVGQVAQIPGVLKIQMIEP
jgi:hypothetical protein